METDEKIILKRLKQGDYFSFELLFKKYQPKLFTIAYRIIRDEEKAREIVHDVFLNIWDNRENLEIKKNIEAYLVVKTKGYSLNALRKKMRDLNLVSETDLGIFKLETEFYQDEQVTLQMSSDSLYERFEKVVSELPDQQKLIFRMSRIDGLTSREISEQIKITPRTVETHIYHALKTIKSKMGDLLK